MSKKISEVYAFIDSQNLNLSTSKNIYKKHKLIYKGWKLDFKKFRKYLSDKFRVQRAYFFIGYISHNKSLYSNLEKWGYDLVFKPTVIDKKGNPKGNVDAELVLHTAAIEFGNYDKAIIVSGDGDFRCLHEFLEDRRKLGVIVIPNAHTESSLLKPFQEYKVFLSFEKNKLEFNSKKNGGRRS